MQAQDDLWQAKREDVRTRGLRALLDYFQQNTAEVGLVAARALALAERLTTPAQPA